MLPPSYIAGISDEIAAIWSEFEADLTADVARRIVKMGVISDTAALQLEKAREIGLLRESVDKKLAQLSGYSEKQINKLLKEAALEAFSYDDPIYRAAGFVPMGLTDNPVLSSILLQGTRSAKAVLESYTHTTAKATELAFRNSVDKAYLQYVSGAYDNTTAIRNAVKALAKNGITAVAYPSGAVHSADVAVRRAVITGANQTVAKLQLARASEMGCDLVEVTSHAGARPSHAEWQGHVYSISGKHPKYADFYRSTGYGDGDGLCGWNCYHNFYPYFEGFSTQAFTEDPSADAGRDNDRDYELSQQQRYYERQIRKSKQECMTIKAASESATDEATKEALERDYNTASLTLKRREAKLQQFIDTTGRTRLRDREQTGAWTVKDAAQARGAAQASHNRWLRSINAQSTELNSVAKYYEAKYNNSPEYQVLMQYSRDVRQGWVSPLVGFSRYKDAIDTINSNLVGMTAANGVVITAQSEHFVTRIMGTMVDPHILREEKRIVRRSGVELEDIIYAALHGDVRDKRFDKVKKRWSQQLIGKNCAVSINPDTGKLINCNPL